MADDFKTNDKYQSVWEKYGPKDFLYGRKGPWPQPSPSHPMGEAPAVLNIPKEEAIDFSLFVGTRYLSQIFLYGPLSYAQMVFKPGLEEVSDKEFENLYTNTILSKHLIEGLDEEDKKQFADFINNEDKLFIVDFSPVKSIKTYKGIYASATKTLFKETGKYQYQVLAIYVEKTNEIFTPIDGDAWELAKYYSLQGAGLVTTLLKHPLLHFPYDQINAITKTAVPKSHVLFRLLSPHWRFTLPLENAVLQSSTSIVANNRWLPYTLYPGKKEFVMRLLVHGYKGMKGNNSYPGFSYPTHPPKIHSTYGDYLERYFNVILKFTKEIVKDIPADDYYTRNWANYVSHQSPGFPDASQIFEGDTLARVLAIYIWAVSVAHSVDHYDYGKLDVRKVPMRLRQDPPIKGSSMISRKKLTTWIDNAKYRLAQLMFYDVTTITFLKDCKYVFDDPVKDGHAEQFFKDLRKLDKELKEEGICYMDFDEIASSVQY